MREQNTTQGSMMQDVIAPGTVMGVTLVALSVIFYVANYDGGFMLLANIFATGATMVYFTIQYRDKKRDGFISYGRSLGFGTLMSLVASILNAIYFVVFVKLINPDYFDIQMDKAAQQMLEQGVNEAQIEAGMKMAKLFATPAFGAMSLILSGVFVGVIIALIVSIFIKRDNYQQNF
ncbi:MAG: DUF4199 domain-containing protein [Prevotellaceae bacterium]|jgi:hypothetical protein|nr:DUF4199 domain-containing protein [Prevotellaceae bacterium]